MALFEQQNISSAHYWHDNAYYISFMYDASNLWFFTALVVQKVYTFCCYHSLLRFIWNGDVLFTLMRRQNSFDHISIYSNHNVLSLSFHLVPCSSRNLMKWTQHNMNPSTIQIWTVNIILVPCYKFNVGINTMLLNEYFSVDLCSNSHQGGTDLRRCLLLLLNICITCCVDCSVACHSFG